MLRIGDLAARTGVTVRALRYYEEQHLLSASRAASGHRLYPDSAVERVRMIQRMFATGLSSRMISAVCPLGVESGPDDTGHERLAALLSERDRLAREVQELAATQDRLDLVIRDVRDARASG
ncbi:MerR family transcriptional regulator [Winogradskya humida]|uniref:MerR family transcriptional regulator n=1 Tax=Winogradskya humida TaxID=113566 RepID=A0ABQ3ZL23_9ACTN|nr:MerR family transcriptional regulator [Actinoplanes humidus]GIE19290.1 MerR family transcriptional regulator [Actinoplanes humidus]